MGKEARSLARLHNTAHVRLWERTRHTYMPVLCSGIIWVKLHEENEGEREKEREREERDGFDILFSRP